MFLRLESLYIYIKDSDAIYVTFFRMAAQELLSYTNAQDGLLQVLDYLDQADEPSDIPLLLLPGLVLGRERGQPSGAFLASSVSTGSMPKRFMALTTE